MADALSREEIEPTLTPELARRLVDAQFPQYAGLPIHPVGHQGWDNVTLRLGDGLSIRLPTAQGYVASVAKEHRWLPVLAEALRGRTTIAIPEPVALGAPGPGYPFPWSIYAWLEGEPLIGRQPTPQLAADVADFLVTLRSVDATDGPGHGIATWHRGGGLDPYAEEAFRSLAALNSHGRIEVDPELATDVLQTALASRWTGDPVWFHGDVAPGNLLVRDDRLSAAIDFGTAGTGDPACDTVIAWTTFTDPATRETFTDHLDLDADTWARGRGWALWKALLVMAGAWGRDLAEVEVQRRVVDQVLADHRRG